MKMDRSALWNTWLVSYYLSQSQVLMKELVKFYVCATTMLTTVFTAFFVVFFWGGRRGEDVDAPLTPHSSGTLKDH